MLARIYLLAGFAPATRWYTVVSVDVLPSFDLSVSTSVNVLPSADRVARASNDPSVGKVAATNYHVTVSLRALLGIGNRFILPILQVLHAAIDGAAPRKGEDCPLSSTPSHRHAMASGVSLRMVKVADFSEDEPNLLCVTSSFHTPTADCFAVLVWATASDELRSTTKIVAVFTFFSIVSSLHRGWYELMRFAFIALPRAKRKQGPPHVTGGRVFGYDNVEVPGTDGKRAYVARRVNEAEAAIVKQLATVERDLVRLTAAVTAGGELDTLVAAIKEREKAREALRLELRSLERAGRAATLDLPAVERQLRAKLDEWKAVLRKHVPQARQVLKKLLAGPLVFTAHREAGGALLRVLWAACDRSDYQRVSVCKYGGVPSGIRTRVLALKGPRPRPLDDGDWKEELIAR